MPQMPDDEKLKLFVHRCQEIVECRIWDEGGLSVHISLTGSGVLVQETDKSVRVNMDGTRARLQEPDVDNLRSFLTIFRQFISRNEPVYIQSIVTIAQERLLAEHANMAKRFEGYLENWEFALSHSTLNVVVDSSQLSPQDVLTLYINGQYFHNDYEKRVKLEQFKKYAVRVDRIRFVQTLADLTEIILHIGNDIGYGLKNNWFSFSEMSHPPQ